MQYRKKEKDGIREKEREKKYLRKKEKESIEERKRKKLFDKEIEM